MEEKLVTLAIRTYQRAKMIQSVLEQAGIETFIHNLNLEHPEMAVGVRVRIKEKDLPQALKIVEAKESDWEKEETKTTSKKVLIPIDFSDCVSQTIDFGFLLASNMGAEVVLMYVYFSPAFTLAMNNDVSTYGITDGDLLRRVISSANADVQNMENLVRRRIVAGELPDIRFTFELKEGVPEDQILDFCKKHRPELVVMGSQGKQTGNQVIGSVAAEVIETCEVPVLVIPMHMELENWKNLKRIGYVTNFNQKDLIAIDKTITTFQKPDLEIIFIHGSPQKQAWDEVILSGIKSYFSAHYPHFSIDYALVDATDTPEKIDEVVLSMQIDLLAFNTRKKNLLARIFNPNFAYKLIYDTNTPLFVTKI